MLPAYASASIVIAFAFGAAAACTREQANRRPDITFESVPAWRASIKAQRLGSDAPKGRPAELVICAS